MAKVKKSRKSPESLIKEGGPNSKLSNPFLVKKNAIDPSLASLFASSAGPVRPPPRSRYNDSRASAGGELLRDNASGDSNTGVDSADQKYEGLNSLNGSLEDPSVTGLKEVDASSQPSGIVEFIAHGRARGVASKTTRKRERRVDEGGLEEAYFLRIAKEEEEEEEEEERGAKRRLKRRRLIAEQDPNNPEKEDFDNEGLGESEKAYDSNSEEEGERSIDAPLHETLVPDKEAIELEKSTRTVFLANVSIVAIIDKKAKKKLLEHMVSFVDSLPVLKEGLDKHKVESIRFRSTAYSGGGLPKKAAYVTKSLMDTTTKSTNAYVVYSTALAAREAVKRLNGTMILDRHLRVDSIAHPAKTDHRRCIFVGNLGFIDDESMIDKDGKNDRKRSKVPSDVEEGLWRQFSKVGAVESVRVVRDGKTRVGKGFAYVQFQDANSVEAALLFHGKKFPPMLPRILRVTRAKAVQKTALASKYTQQSSRPPVNGSSNPNRKRTYNPKVSEQELSLQSHAAKLLGKAGAANFRRDEPNHEKRQKRGFAKSPESIIFEGFRASAKFGKPKDLKLGRGKKGKPKNRSMKRATEWRNQVGKERNRQH